MVDIIIPVYNARDTISKTLYSILLQSNLKDLHVYLIDDASSCSYDDIISFFSKKMDLHYFRLEKNSGPGAARQYGIEHSHSKYIMFCDSDDVFYDYFAIENLMIFMNGGGYDVSLGMIVEKFDNEINLYPVRFDVLHAKMYRRSFLKKHQITFPNQYNAEDLAFNNLILMHSPKIGYCNYDTVYVYVRRDGSLTCTNDYYALKHIRSYVDGLKWAVTRAEETSCKKEDIAKIVMESFAYFYFYFSEDYYEESMKYVIGALSLYDDYHSYIRDKDKETSLNFWFGFLGSQKYEFSFEDFIAFCRDREGDYR